MCTPATTLEGFTVSCAASATFAGLQRCQVEDAASNLKQCFLVEQTPGAYSQLPADHPASASTRGESWRYFLQGVHH